jgi:hypothetical protein
VSRAFTIIGFCVCGALALLLWYLSRRNPDKVAPIDELLDQIMVSRAIRLTIIVFWWWLGWHFIVAAPGPVGG